MDRQNFDAHDPDVTLAQVVSFMENIEAAEETDKGGWLTCSAGQPHPGQHLLFCCTTTELQHQQPRAPLLDPGHIHPAHPVELGEPLLLDQAPMLDPPVCL